MHYAPFFFLVTRSNTQVVRILPHTPNKSINQSIPWVLHVFLESLLEIKKVEPFSLSGKFPGN